MCQINAEQLNELLINGTPVNLLDVREAIEFNTFNIGGINIPVNRLAANINKVGYNKTDQIIVICSAGIRSKTAQEILTENGFKTVLNLKGGLRAFQKLK